MTIIYYCTNSYDNGFFEYRIMQDSSNKVLVTMRSNHGK